MSRGFTLIETIAAVFVGTLVVVSLAIVTPTLVRTRADYDAYSAAVALAEAQIEKLRNLPGSHADLAAGSHGPLTVTASDEPLVGSTYTKTWTVVDDYPAAGSKKITVRVRHVNAKLADQTVTTYYIPPS